MSWFDDNQPQLSAAEQTYANQTAAREAYYKANPSLDPTGSFSQQQRTGLANIVTAGSPAPPQAQTPNSPSMSAQDFIKQWQGSHSPDIAALTEALKSAGYTNASRYMYGNTPSNNELSIDGQKFKVISGEDSGNPSWYTPGTNDSGGGGGQSQQQAFTPPPAFNAQPWTETFQGPTAADFTNDAAYQEQLARGADAIQKSAAARGTVLNPGTLKDLSDWTTGTASAEGDKLYARKSQEYGQRYNQYLNSIQQQAAQQQQQYAQSAGTFGINYGVWNDDVNRFIGQQNTAFNQNLSLAQLGLYGANGATGAGTNYANQGGNAITGGADATASGIVGGANAINNGIGQGINAGTSLYALSRYGSPYTSRLPFTSGSGSYGMIQ